jgi:toxin YoeB
LIELFSMNPFAHILPYEKLVGELKNFCSRRINIQYRIVYELDEKEKVVKVLRMWTHYEQRICLPNGVNKA